MLTTDERNDLHEQAAQLSYAVIRLADLSPLLSCEEWDGLADTLGREVMIHIEQRIEQRRDELEAKAGREMRC